jgi:hypothetical protein
LPQPSQHLPAVQLGHHHVQHDDLWRELLRQFQCLIQAVCAQQAIAGTGGIALHQLDGVGVVIDGQNRQLLDGGQGQRGAKGLVLGGEVQPAAAYLGQPTGQVQADLFVVHTGSRRCVPLALGDNGIWAFTHLFETVLLGTMGPEMYRSLWTGDTDWGGAEVTQALENLAKMMDYVNADRAALSWDQAAQLVADGDAAATIMGDWAEGYFLSIGLAP